MAIDFTKPATSDNYSTAFVPNIQANQTALAQWLDSGVVTITGTPPTNAKRFNATSGLIEFYNGTVWGALATGYVKKTGDTMSGDLAGTNFRILSSATTDAGTFGFSNSNGPGIIAWGSASPGAGKLEFILAGAKQFHLTPVASAVNVLAAAGAITGVRPSLSAVGSDTNVGLSFAVQGAGDFVFFGASGTQLQINSAASANRWLVMTGSNGGNPSLSASSGQVAFGSQLRMTAGGAPSDVSAVYSFLANDKLSWIDSARAANNKEVEFLWAGGVLQGRFVNDAYSASSSWVEVTGGQASGVSGINFFTGATQINTLRLAGTFVNVNNVNSNTVTYQLQVTGAGQQVAAPTDAGSKSGALYLLDTASAGVGNGGLLAFGGFGSATPFAAIKGFITNAASNTQGEIAFSTRNGATDTALTERMRLTSAGALQFLAGNTGGGLVLPNALNTSATVLDWYEEGTFTPVAVGLTTAGTGTYSSQVGRFVRIGRLVYVTIQLQWTAHTGAGVLQINGLPYASALTIKSLRSIPAATGIAFDAWNAGLTAGSANFTLEGLSQNSGANASRSLFSTDLWTINGFYEV